MHKTSRRILFLLFCCLLLTATIITGCKERVLRGHVVASADGQTYLVVEDNNGGGCGPIMVDGKKWPHPLHVPGIIRPGSHVIACGGEIGFEIRKGTIFHFDYWGP